MLEHGDDTRVAMAVMIMSSPRHDDGRETLRGWFSRRLADLPVPAVER